MRTTMKFDYGDEVVFRQADRNNDLAGKTCSIVGITPIETEDQVRVFGYPLGTVLYTVEFGDGSDKLVPEAALESASEH
jgi:hypothetical protein